MGRNKRAPSSTAAVVVVPEADGDVVPPPLPSMEEAAIGAGELTAEEEEGDGEGEAARLKELNAVLLREVRRGRGQVAALTELVEELAIAAATEVADAAPLRSLPPAAATQESAVDTDAARGEAAAAVAVELEAGAQEAEAKAAAVAASKKVADDLEAAANVDLEEEKKSVELRAERLGEPEKKQVGKKKKAPVRLVEAHKAAAVAEAKTENISTAGTAPANACEAGQEPEAGRAPGGRPRRIKKPNTLYPTDTWVR